MALKALESRSYACEVRAFTNENGYNIVGRPIVYESRTNLGDFDEVISRGALNEADLTDVRFLVNHDLRGIPLARSRRNNGNSTMRLSPDYDGMEIAANVDVENNSQAKSLYSATERGDITGMSFMFSIDGEEWEDLDSDHPTRRITKIGSVIEVSAVTIPAYDATSISARSAEELESAKAALENARAKFKSEQRSINPVETGSNELELAKAKLNFISKV